MEQEFGYPQFDREGVKVVTRIEGVCANMLQNITIYRLTPGESREFYLPEEEAAFLLMQGKLDFAWQGENRTVSRDDFFTQGAYCLHVCKNMRVRLTALAASEVLVQSTPNERLFAPVFYTPENTVENIFGKDLFEGKAQRLVRTFFDYHNAPHSNMVCGEIVNPQGGWSSYPPHQHPQPEVYYYRFDKPQGFGACFIGDSVYTIRDGSFSAIPGGKCHPQVNAPGYPMYYVWMIRHFDNAPWTERIYDPAHTWMLE